MRGHSVSTNLDKAQEDAATKRNAKKPWYAEQAALYGMCARISVNNHLPDAVYTHARLAAHFGLAAIELRG